MRTKEGAASGILEAKGGGWGWVRRNTAHMALFLVTDEIGRRVSLTHPAPPCLPLLFLSL